MGDARRGGRLRVGSVLLRSVVSVGAAVACALATFDLLWLQPRLAQLRGAAPPVALDSGGLVAQMVHPADPLPVVTRILLDSGAPFARPSRTGRNAAGLLAQALLPLHCTERELLALYATHVPVGGESHGLRAFARARFGRELSALSPTEAATVVAWPHAPAYYGHRPDALGRRRDVVLARWRAARATDERDVPVARQTP